MLDTDKTSQYRGKVMTIMFFYNICGTIGPEKEVTNYYASSKTFERMAEVAKTDFTLFKLNAAGTPFMKTAKRFQYVLLIQNQRAMKRLKLRR